MTLAEKQPLAPAPDEFPPPLASAEHIEHMRRTRLDELQRIAISGVWVRVAVIVVEAASLWWWRYAALVTDTVASALDVISSFAIVMAIRSAARPPDANHPFGHGRIEPLAGLQIGVLLVVAGAGLALRHLGGLAESSAAGFVSPWAWLIPGAACVALELVARRVAGIASQEQSSALTAEAGHYRVDALTSLVASIGLAAAAMIPAWGRSLDLVCGAALAVIMVVLGVLAVRENLRQLLDHVPQDAHFEQVRRAALKVAGVRGVEKLRIQQAGPDAHIDIDIEVDPEMTVAAAHLITQQVRAQIQSDWPFVREVVVHVEPYYAGDH
jgi:cation diffusion facilitator family transporter